MFNRILIVSAFVTIAYSHDIAVGDKTDGRKIFDEARQASPAIWRQAQNLTVNATDAEVISRVVVKDLRPEKDGEAKVVDGGVGQKSVTLELKSPAALRGYDFHVEVYTSPDENASGAQSKPNPTRIQRNSQSSDDVNIPQTRTDLPRFPESYTNVPVLTKDAKINNNAQSGNSFVPTFTETLSTTDVNFNVPKNNIPVTPSTVNTQNNGQGRYDRDGEINKGNNPTITSKDFENQNPSEVQEYELRTSNRKVRNAESEDASKSVNFTPSVPLNLGKDLVNDTLPRTKSDRRDDDGKSSTPSYHYQHHATNDDRKTRDTKNDASTQIPRLLTNKPTVSNVKNTESEGFVSVKTNNEPNYTTPKVQNTRRARDSDENVEINPPAFQNTPGTPSEDSKNKNLPLNKPTTTSTTTAKSRKREAETEFPVTLSPKDDDDEDDYRPKAVVNGTRLLPPKPVISLQ